MQATAAPGDLDRSFGGDGRVALAGAGAFVARAVEVDDRGRIVVGGYLCQPDPVTRDATCLGSGDASFRLARLTPDGGLDPEFGANGFVTTPVGEGRSEALDIALMGDRRILVGGVARSGGRDVLALARYLPDGTLDSSFGAGGTAVAPAGPAFVAATDVALGPRHTVLAAGQAVDANGAARMAIARFADNGALDTTFGTGGVALGAPTAFGYGLSMALRPGGSTLVAGLLGDSADPATFRFAQMQVNGDGLPDRGFDGDGFAEQRPGTSSSFANAVIGTDDGGWLAAGAATVGDGRQAITVVRGRGDGGLVRRFAGGGQLLIPLRDGAVANDALLDRAQRPLLVGQAASGGGYRFATVRLDADGARDRSFGKRGVSIFRWPGYPIARATAGALEPSGKLVTVGIGCVGGTGWRCLGGTARLLVARQTIADDTTAPAIRVRPPGRVTQRRLRGLKLRIGLSEPGKVHAQLSGKRRANGRRVVLWRSKADAYHRTYVLRLRPARAHLDRMRSRLRLDIRASDRAGNAAVRRLRLALRR